MGCVCPPVKGTLVSTLATLSAASQSKVAELTSKLNNRKDWVISEIVSVYKSDAAITPQHLLVGVTGKFAIGAVFAGWYVFKSGVNPSDLNITFIANNYPAISVKDSPSAMLAEIDSVYKAVQSADKAAADADNQSGVAFKSALNDLSKAFDKVSAKIVSQDTDAVAAVMLLQVRMASLAKAVGLQQEKTPVSVK